MKEDPPSILSELEALRAELKEVKQRLNALERVVQIDEEDGRRHVSLQCNEVVVRPEEDPRYLSIVIGGQITEGPFIRFFHCSADRITTPLEMHLDEDGTPHIQLLGSDGHARGDFFIEKDHGTLVVLGPGYQPGAVMRAMPGGGSVAVLQPDGKSRGVLVHDEGTDSTELILATAEGKVLSKLHADKGGGLLSVGTPGHPNGAVLCSRFGLSSLMLKDPADSHGVTCAAGGGLSMVSAYQGESKGAGTRAELIASPDSSGVSLWDEGNNKRVDLSAGKGVGSVSILDEDSEQPAIYLSHVEGSHSSLTMTGVAGHDCLQIIANEDLTTMKLASPQSEETQWLCSLVGDEPSVFLRKDGLIQVAMGTGGSGGWVGAYGPESEKAGCAMLSGGPIAGSLVISTLDGMPQLTLDATDYGGRLAVNNDIGFQRILLGTYQESSSLILNHTGSEGVAISALPHGGLITLYDSEGKPVQHLPDNPEENP